MTLLLPQYDYTQAGAYFITIVTYQRELVFDDPSLRKIIETFWQPIPLHIPRVRLDTLVVMPNHLHAILWLLNTSIGQHDAAKVLNAALRRAWPHTIDCSGVRLGNRKPSHLSR